MQEVTKEVYLSIPRRMMKSLGEEEVYIDFENNLMQTTAESTDDGRFFVNEFFGDFPDNCCRPPSKLKKTKKRAAPETVARKHCGVVDLVDKSPRQARRNARERGRKARMNHAFQVLRSVVPKTVDPSQERKLTQVEILRLAKNYICSLTTMLQTCNEEVRGGHQDFNTSPSGV